MEQVSLKIGERLKEIRNTRQLTLDDVAELTGVSKPMLGQIERGQSSPTINILWKISGGNPEYPFQRRPYRWKQIPAGADGM